MGTAKELAAATQAYEAWVDRCTPTVAPARLDKHAAMATGPFPFLRATYYRWAALVGAAAPSPPGPVVAAVGDLHVENFGTWRDGEGRLVWGVNDLDEAEHLPAAYDLLRLACSVEIARGHGALGPAGADTDTVTALLAGYDAALRADGLPAVLDRPDPPGLVGLLPAAHAERWWARMLALPVQPDPLEHAVTLLTRAMPAGAGPVTVHARAAGLGSRDHLRLVGVASCAGAPVLREAKALAPPATWWLTGRPPRARVGALATALLRDARHSPDPSLQIRGGWVVRRLAPWSDRIELADLRRRADVDALLHWMGVETANVHLASASAADLAALTTTRAARWLASRTATMVATTLAEATAWRRIQQRGQGREPLGGRSPDPSGKA